MGSRFFTTIIVPFRPGAAGWRPGEWECLQAGLIIDLRPDTVRLEIRDDGVGFEVEPTLGRLANGGHTSLLMTRCGR